MKKATIASIFLLAFAVSMSMFKAVCADTTYPCAYTGYAFIDGQAVPPGTGIRAL
jgi:hypothetical protein